MRQKRIKRYQSASKKKIKRNEIYKKESMRVKRNQGVKKRIKE